MLQRVNVTSTSCCRGREYNDEERRTEIKQIGTGNIATAILRTKGYAMWQARDWSSGISTEIRGACERASRKGSSNYGRCVDTQTCNKMKVTIIKGIRERQL